MIAIAKVQTQSRELNQVQENISQAVKPVLNNALTGGAFLTNISLKNGSTVIPHGLGRMQQGWMITDINGAATVYRSANFNDQNLTLTSSAAVTATIYVF